MDWGARAEWQDREMGGWTPSGWRSLWNFRAISISDLGKEGRETSPEVCKEEPFGDIKKMAWENLSWNCLIPQDCCHVGTILWLWFPHEIEKLCTYFAICWIVAGAEEGVTLGDPRQWWKAVTQGMSFLEEKFSPYWPWHDYVTLTQFRRRGRMPTQKPCLWSYGLDSETILHESVKHHEKPCNC